MKLRIYSIFSLLLLICHIGYAKQYSSAATVTVVDNSCQCTLYPPPPGFPTPEDLCLQSNFYKPGVVRTYQDSVSVDTDTGQIEFYDFNSSGWYGSLAEYTDLTYLFSGNQSMADYYQNQFLGKVHANLTIDNTGPVCTSCTAQYYQDYEQVGFDGKFDTTHRPNELNGTLKINVIQNSVQQGQPTINLYNCAVTESISLSMDNPLTADTKSEDSQKSIINTITNWVHSVIVKPGQNTSELKHYTCGSCGVRG